MLEGTMPDEIQTILGAVLGRIYYSHDKSWNRIFRPSAANAAAMEEAVKLYYEHPDLAFLTLFKAVESEAKRHLGKEYENEKPEKLIQGLRERNMVTEWEFHLLNGLRALRNEIGHGKVRLPESEELQFLSALTEAALISTFPLLMHIQSKAA